MLLLTLIFMVLWLAVGFWADTRVWRRELRQPARVQDDERDRLRE